MLLTAVYLMLTFGCSAYRNIVCGLSSLTLCSDVHCPVVVNLEAVSDYGALLIAQGQPTGEESLSVLSY